MGGWWQDLVYAGRMFRKHPGASALAVVALALGIGLTATMFSIVQGAILRGLPFEESDKIQFLSVVTPTTQGRGDPITYHDFTDWRSQQTSFEALEGYTGAGMTVTGTSGYPERLRGARVTPGLFRALRVTPILGRDFTEADAQPGAPAVLIIGRRVWETRYASRPDAIGQTLNVNGVPTTVIGVMPPKFGFPQTHNAWQPLSFTLAPKRATGGRLNVIGRLKGDTSLQRASSEMQRISDQLVAAYPENKDTRAKVAPFVSTMLGEEVINTLFTMLAAVFGVMIIACVNVTNLQLARAAERTKEVAVRVAIGAGRWRIVRQTLVEGLLLSFVGALGGLGLALAGTALFRSSIVDTNPPFWIDVRLDPVVLAFVTAITVTAALVSSLVPGWRLARTDVNGALKDEGRGTTSLRMGRFSRWLVVVEVAVSCILLVVSGLMIRSIVQNSRFDAPFATKDVFFGSVNLDDRQFPNDPDVVRANELVEEKLSQVPGVRAVALASDYPRGGGGTRVAIDGKSFDNVEAHPRAHVITASTKYFDVLRVRPLMGRLLEPGDASGGALVAVVDETFARQHLPEGPIGRRIRFGVDSEKGTTFDTSPWLTVVGVIPALVEPGPANNNNAATIFRPLAQRPRRDFFVFASAGDDPTAISAGVRQALAQIGEGTPIVNINSLADELKRQGWATRVFGGLFMTFGVAALFLASVGLYGVMAFGVKQRTGEIGVRMAMGADRGTVLRMILWQGLWRVALAVAVGLVPGWLVGGLMEGLLNNVSPSDPLVLSATALTLLVSGALASLAPALRAASVDPIVALRGES
ncbi:MAG TPA: ABC transporter permease [Vicinamibacterales bacterium]|nr:ABC transporter permease [Vicinamibacterales bacterium]